MRALIVLLVIVVGGGPAAAQVCNRMCPAKQMDGRGCCPKQLAPLVKPAKPTAPSADHVKRRLAAERLEAEANTARTNAKYIACGQAYLEAFDAEPEADDTEALMLASAACFEKGNSLGAALNIYHRVTKYYPSKPSALRALGRTLALYKQIGSFGEAASAEETYARQFTDERDAYLQLLDAIEIRAGLSDDAALDEDVRLFAKLFGAKKPYEAATAQLVAVDQAALRGRVPWLDALRAYIRVHGVRGGEDRLARVHAEIAVAAWRQACPATTLLSGLCVARAPARPDSEGCVSVTERPLAVIPRTAALVGQARTAAAAAGKLYAKVATPSDDVRHAVALAKLVEAEIALEGMLALQRGPGDFDRQLKTWQQKRIAAGQQAKQLLEGVLALKDASASIDAAARIGFLQESLGRGFAGVTLPPAIENTPAKKEAFCDVALKLIEPLEVAAREAYTACVTQSSKLVVYNASTTICETRLTAFDPKAHPENRELLPTPTNLTIPVQFEPPDRAGITARELVSAAEELAALEGKWTPADCKRMGEKLTGLAKSFGATAHYLAGIAYARCAMYPAAATAFGAAIRIDPKHARAHANLGAVLFAGGDRVRALASLGAALAIDQKLVAAQLDLALDKLMQRRAESDRATQDQLGEQAQKAAMSALAIEPTSNAAQALLALIWMEGSERNIGRLRLAKLILDRAKSRAPGTDPLLAVAAGALYLRSKQLDRALMELEIAAPTNAEAAFDEALLLIQVKQYAKAKQQLALIAVAKPSYELLLVTGVVARGLLDFKAAEVAYRAAIAVDDKRPEGHHALAILTGYQTDTLQAGAALPLYRRAVEGLERALARATTAELKSTIRDDLATFTKTVKQLEIFAKSHP